MLLLYKGFKYDNRYDYVKLFSTVESQRNFFRGLGAFNVTKHNYIKDNVDSFKVPYEYDFLVSEGINYIMFNNGYKDIYAFIIKKEYVSDDVTRIIYEVDVMQTYMFDFKLRKSFVERKVCQLSEVADFDEGLSLGEHTIESVVCQVQKEHKYFAMFGGIKQNELIFSGGQLTNVIDMPSPTLKPTTMIDNIPYPMYFMELQSSYAPPIVTDIGTDGGSGGGSGEGDGGEISDAKISRQGFRFIKGYEGFAPRRYQDSGGYWTIAYGVTLHGEPSIYNDLVSKQPVDESYGAKVSYDLKNSNYVSKIIERVKNLGCTHQYQLDALTSLAYNCGYGVVTGDNNLMNAIKSDPTNEGAIRPIWEKFYVTSGGTYLPGLASRRKQECNMFFNKTYEVRKISTINSSGNIDGYVTENGGNGWLP